MKSPRVSETIFYDHQRIVEVRSRPLWVVILELWFLYAHEFWSHVLRVRLPEDPYWGEPLEAGFHKFYYWSLNHKQTIDRTERLA